MRLLFWKADGVLMFRQVLFGLLLIAVFCAAHKPIQAAPYPDRWVWVFGWNLSRNSDTDEIAQVLQTAGTHGLNGAVLSLGLDTLCKKSPDYFRRLEEVKAAAGRHNLELIPSVFSVGYGGAALSHDRNLAEGLPVKEAEFLVKGGEARFVRNESVHLANGGFEEFTGHKLNGFNFHDQPGEVSFSDPLVKHSGQASLRLENFTSNPHGHGRVMQEIRVQPHRSYRVSVWVKTEGLQPAGAFRLQVLVKNRSLAPRSFNLPATTDWQKLSMLFNSLEFDSVRLYAGLWCGKAGKVWLDDWTVEEVGPMNALRRPGTPVSVRSEDGRTTYQEGRDYAPLLDPNYSVHRIDREAPTLKLLPGSRIPEGGRLRVNWYHPMIINDSQITVCMAEPALYDYFEHEAKLLSQHLKPRRILLNMDEIRMGGTCLTCQGRNMGELLGQCITRQAQILRQHNPGTEIYIWSDMLDPDHNGGVRPGNTYYHVNESFTGSWNLIPQDLKFGLRMLAKAPVVSTVAAVSLALGIAANASIFAILNGFLFKPLPYQDQDHLVMLREGRQGATLDEFGGASVGNFRDYEASARTLGSAMIYTIASANLTGGDIPEQLNVVEGTPNLFDVLGVQPALGRSFRQEEGTAGLGQVLVLEYDFWQSRFRRRPGG